MPLRPMLLICWVENMPHLFNVRESPRWCQARTHTQGTESSLYLLDTCGGPFVRLHTYYYHNANNESQFKDILSHCLTMRMLNSNVLLIELTDISCSRTNTYLLEYNHIRRQPWCISSITLTATTRRCKKKIQIHSMRGFILFFRFFSFFFFFFFSCFCVSFLLFLFFNGKILCDTLSMQRHGIKIQRRQRTR